MVSNMSCSPSYRIGLEPNPTNEHRMMKKFPAAAGDLVRAAAVRLVQYSDKN